MRENNRKPIEKCRRKLPQFTTMNVIDGQAGLINYSSLIFYSLTIDNILNIIVLLILAGVGIATLTGDNGILTRAQDAKNRTEEAAEQEESDLARLEDLINQSTNGGYIESKGVNQPYLLEGMTKIMFKLPEDSSKGEVIKAGEEGFDENNWYDYNSSKWANAMTEDGSMWVWIPRFAYTLNETNQTIDVKFLVGTTDQYYDDNGILQTASRATSKDETIDTSSGYYVHPVFTNENSIDYVNGGWDEELTGIWVAKFEAGYTDISNKDIQKPVFQPLAYSMNYTTINDSYKVSRNLTNSGNIYGLNSTATDSHLMKNSEWGAVAYLAYSIYGGNTEEPYVNNINVNNNISTVYAITGLTTGFTSEGPYTTTAEYLTNVKARTGNDAVNGIYAWDQEEGQKASSTLNMYGIYDLSGGSWEGTAGYIANGNSNLKTYGESVAYENGVLKTTSTKYTTVYPNTSSEDSNIDTASGQNYPLNTKIFGDAIRETSSSGTGTNSWNRDTSYFPALNSPFTIRGGYYETATKAGLFAFNRTVGTSHSIYGFRSVLVAL